MRSIPIVLLAVLVQIITVSTMTVQAGELVVRRELINDRKAVFATVESSVVIAARARIGGTIATLKVDEGARVERGEVIATIGDQKLVLRMNALEARIAGQEAQVKQAQIDFERNNKLYARNTIAKARLDTARTNLDVAQNQLKSLKAELAVIAQQLDEGKVLAPAPGRVLEVPVTSGAVIMPGEPIARIAAGRYILRLELPERHARFIHEGDTVLLGSRGLSPIEKIIGQGTIRQVYPKLSHGRVIADVDAPGLGDYFVGERVRVLISAGKRQTMLIPADYTFLRYGLTYVKLARKNGRTEEIVVQLGQTVFLKDNVRRVEVLAGLEPGDRLVKP